MSDNNMMDFEIESEAKKAEPTRLSTFRSNLLTEKINEIPMCDLGSLKVMKFRVEANEDYAAGSLFCLCKLPPSEIRIFFKLSDMTFMGVNDGDFGWSKYRTRKRENIPTSPKGFNDAVVNGSTVVVDSIEGIFFNFITALEGKKGDYIEGYIIYSKM